MALKQRSSQYRSNKKRLDLGWWMAVKTSLWRAAIIVPRQVGGSETQHKLQLISSDLWIYRVILLQIVFLTSILQPKQALIVWESENGFATDNPQSWRILQLITREDIPQPFVLVDTIWLELQLVIQQSGGLNKRLTALQVSLMEIDLIKFNANNWKI